MKLLVSASVRKAADIRDDNRYVFASIQESTNHVSGWHAVNNVCSKANIKSKELLTATKNRHRVSTLFACLDLSRKDRELFYAHMGHSEMVNEAIYQAPPALLEITKVGKQLQQIDQGTLLRLIYTFYTYVAFLIFTLTKFKSLFNPIHARVYFFCTIGKLKQILYQ